MEVGATVTYSALCRRKKKVYFGEDGLHRLENVIKENNIVRFIKS